jgi:hypothetical protein
MFIFPVTIRCIRECIYDFIVCFLTLHGLFPVSSLMLCNIKCVQHGFTGRPAVEGRVPRIGLGFTTHIEKVVMMIRCQQRLHRRTLFGFRKK